MRNLVARLRSLDAGPADAVLGFAFLVDVTIELLLLPDPRPDLGAAFALVVAMGAAIALRRRLPVTAAVVGWCVFLGLDLLPTVYSDRLVAPPFLTIFLAYSAGRHADDRGAAIAGGLGTVLMLIASSIDGSDDTVANSLSTVAFAVAAPILIGRFMRHRAHLHATLRVKTLSLNAERAQRAKAAADEERTRIAGELHDVVAHALSAMVVQAGGARRLAERDPVQAGNAFQAVETTGREALTEIRALLGVLRREDEEIALAPQPSLRHIASLVERVRASGLPIDLLIEGDVVDLPAGVDLTAYRVVQEALRVAAEQGAAGAATVRLRYAGDHVDLRVDDDGAWPVRELPGIRERVGFYGGQLRAGAGRDGGHSVRARLPVEGTA